MGPLVIIEERRALGVKIKRQRKVLALNLVTDVATIIAAAAKAEAIVLCEDPPIRCPSLSILWRFFMLRAADRYAYTGSGSTAYCYLFYLGNEQILIHIGKCCRSSA